MKMNQYHIKKTGSRSKEKEKLISEIIFLKI